jgi:hypothetical protein
MLLEVFPRQNRVRESFQDPFDKRLDEFVARVVRKPLNHHLSVSF